MKLLRFFSSLQLTIICLSISMVLIFMGTLDQVHLGIYGALEKYFRSFVVFWSLPNLGWEVPILPGGYLVGCVLLVNLLAAHFSRYKPGWKKLGITLIHFGVVVLLVGELLSSLFQEDSQMSLDEGETKSYAQSIHETELVVINTTDPDKDIVLSVPEARLGDLGVIRHPSIPFTLGVVAFYENADIARRTPETPYSEHNATNGLGKDLIAFEKPRTGKIDERNLVTAYVTVKAKEGPLDTWMVCNAFNEPQHFDYEGHHYEISLREKRDYYPFKITLIDFTHDRYPGTDIPKNFASQIRLQDTTSNEDRETRIYMNHPLRYKGLTFFQASFANNDTTSILQVVRNPSRHLPYIASTLIALGLTFQFCLHLFGFFKRRKTS